MQPPPVDYARLVKLRRAKRQRRRAALAHIDTLAAQALLYASAPVAARA